MSPMRIGVVFGGRSGETEVAMRASASVIAAVERGGHTVVPIGIARDGRWVVGGDPLRTLAAEARIALPAGDATGDVKKALADRAEARVGTSETAVARVEPPGGLPAELREALDVVIIMLHGPYGEDGTIQGLFELADLPYAGAGVLASAVGMDKAMMKAVFRAHGLPGVEYLVALRREWHEDPAGVARRIAETIGFPCFVKPSNLGSSVGITKVADAAALAPALDEAARHDRKILVERAVHGREIEVSVLGNEAPVASLPGEVRYDGEWDDYATGTRADIPLDRHRRGRHRRPHEPGPRRGRAAPGTGDYVRVDRQPRGRRGPAGTGARPCLPRHPDRQAPALLGVAERHRSRVPRAGRGRRRLAPAQAPPTAGGLRHRGLRRPARHAGGGAQPGTDRRARADGGAGVGEPDRRPLRAPHRGDVLRDHRRLPRLQGGAHRQPTPAGATRRLARRRDREIRARSRAAAGVRHRGCPGRPAHQPDRRTGPRSPAPSGPGDPSVRRQPDDR